ncbi:hypothetical protein GEV33_009352 [Tenebrio molitor]|uniref:Uncharacterized protein n=1 Tax=Tenebrio molitor TaxID=7067 RepID=A0A8J6HEY6_TENMO|nr:hypothetical protein GEV33_009352 [Tenebrio molitor]
MADPHWLERYGMVKNGFERSGDKFSLGIYLLYLCYSPSICPYQDLWCEKTTEKSHTWSGTALGFEPRTARTQSEDTARLTTGLGVGRRVEIVDRRHVRLREAKAQTGDSEKTTNPTRGLFHYALHTGFKGFCDVDEDKAARNVEWQDRKRSAALFVAESDAPGRELWWLAPPSGGPVRSARLLS